MQMAGGPVARHRPRATPAPRCGSAPSHRGSACGNGSPDGGLIGLGTSPVRITRLRPCAPRLRDRHRRQQRLGVGVQRHLEQARLVGHLDDAAEIHDRDPVADVLDHRQIVRDEQVGQLELVLQIHQQVDDLRLDRDVERRDRLVADDQLRVQRQRAGDADALALAAGEFVRIGTASARAAARPARTGRRPARAAPAASPTPWMIKRLADDLAGRHARVERGVGVLVDHLHAPPVGQHLRRGRAR